MLVAVAVYAPCVADADEMDDLEALFEEDPAQRFVVAAKMLKRPLKAGDLAGMLQIIELPADCGGQLGYWSVADDMIDVAIPVTQDAGEWGLLGDIHMARAKMIWASLYWSGGMIGRFEEHLRLAEKAYAKAGGVPNSSSNSKRLFRRSGGMILHLSTDTTEGWHLSIGSLWMRCTRRSTKPEMTMRWR